MLLYFYTCIFDRYSTTNTLATNTTCLYICASESVSITRLPLCQHSNDHCCAKIEKKKDLFSYKSYEPLSRRAPYLWSRTFFSTPFTQPILVVKYRDPSFVAARLFQVFHFHIWLCDCVEIRNFISIKVIYRQ